MKRRSFSSIGEEHGAYIPLIAIALVAMITVVGLTQDATKLFVEQLRQQRAADAGTVAGGLMMLRDPRPTEGEITTVAQLVAMDNLNRNGLFYNSPSTQQYAPVAQFVPPGGNTLQVVTSADSNTLIMGRWVSGKDQHRIGGAASAIRRRVAVSLILDVTGSMGDPATLPCGGAGRPACVPKWQALKDAASQFVARLDPAVDRLSIVWFSTKVSGNAELRATSRFSNIMNKSASIANDILTPQLEAKVLQQGTTSIAAGIQRATEDFQANEAILADYKRVAVLITDGSPNVEPGTLPGTCNSQSGRKQRAQVAAIRAADILRNYATVYAIGIGPADPNASSAFQSVSNSSTDDSYLKTFFMNRVANDGAVSTADKKYSAGGSEGAPLGCIDSYSDISTKAAGESLGTPDGTQLGLLLDRISQKILLQLRS